MKPLKSAFHIHLDQVNNLFAKASHQVNPALWLYLNDLRTPFFMLEALSRIAEKTYKKKTFDHLKDFFKSVEDSLGDLDHYVGIYRIFESDKNINSETLSYFKQQAYEAAENLNNLLFMNGWMDGSALENIEKELKKINWKDTDKENASLTSFYQSEIEECISFAKETKYHFDNVEEDVHELRRKIRWLSIYPHALQGLMKFAPSPAKAKDHLKKYQQPSVLQSPFNILPEKLKAEKPILLEKNNFFALSWLIAELGTLKDEGLVIEALTEVYQNTRFLKTPQALDLAYKTMGKKQRSMQAILDAAEVSCKQFFEEKILEGLVVNDKQKD